MKEVKEDTGQEDEKDADPEPEKKEEKKDEENGEERKCTGESRLERIRKSTKLTIDKTDFELYDTSNYYY